MKKRFGLINQEALKGKYESNKRELFRKYLGENYEVVAFQWEEIKDNIAVIAEQDSGDYVADVPLKSLDAVHLSSLGAINGKISKLIKLIKDFKKLPSTKVVNDPTTMLENFDKQYLLYLQEQGFPVVPTQELGNLTYAELRKLQFKGFEQTIVKPRIFGERMNGVMLTTDLGSEEGLQFYRETYGEHILVQPCIKEITQEGERSIILVGDELSHGICRHRKGWCYNAPESQINPTEPTEVEVEIAKRVLKTWPTKYGVTRFDFIKNKGEPLISEVEMINPGIWIGKGFPEVDKKFMELFKEYIDQLTNF